MLYLDITLKRTNVCDTICSEESEKKTIDLQIYC